jgi:hypothetical protein
VANEHTRDGQTATRCAESKIGRSLRAVVQMFGYSSDDATAEEATLLPSF